MTTDSPTVKSSDWKWLALPLWAFIVLRLAILLVYEPVATDVLLYYQFATATVDSGARPYGDVAIEYPPLGYYAMALPKVLANRSVGPPPPVDRDNHARALERSYQTWFRLEMFVCDVLSLGLFLAVLSRRAPRQMVLGCWGYILTTSLLLEVLYDRLDMGLLALLLLWAYAWTREDQKRSLIPWWHSLAWSAVGLAIAYKVIPVLIVPILVLHDWRQIPDRKEWSPAAWGAGALLLGLLVPQAPCLWQSGWQVFNFVNFHGARGTQIESSWATLQMVLALFGLPIEAAFDHASPTIRGPLSPPLAILSSVAVIQLVAGLLWIGWKWGPRFDRTAAYQFSLFTLVTATLLSKVLSPQFMLWALPLALLLGLELPAIQAQRGRFVTACGGLALLTTIVFPVLYFPNSKIPFLPPVNPYALMELHWLPCALLIMRNLLLAGLVVALGLALKSRRRMA